jgi:hypothetical protein
MRTQRMMLVTLSLLGLFALIARAASLRERDFTGFSGDRVFAAALKAARENFMVTKVDPRNMTFVFHTDVTLTNNFNWTASVVKMQGGVKLVFDVPGRPEVLASRSGERVSELLFEATEENLAKEEIIECGAHPTHPLGSVVWKKG